MLSSLTCLFGNVLPGLIQDLTDLDRRADDTGVAFSRRPAELGDAPGIEPVQVVTHFWLNSVVQASRQLGVDLSRPLKVGSTLLTIAVFNGRDGLMLSTDSRLHQHDHQLLTRRRLNVDRLVFGDASHGSLPVFQPT